MDCSLKDWAPTLTSNSNTVKVRSSSDGHGSAAQIHSLVFLSQHGTGPGFESFGQCTFLLSKMCEHWGIIMSMRVELWGLIVSCPVRCTRQKLRFCSICKMLCLTTQEMSFQFQQIAESTFSSLHESTHSVHKMPQSEFQPFAESAFSNSLKMFHIKCACRITQHSLQLQMLLWDTWGMGEGIGTRASVVPFSPRQSSDMHGSAVWICSAVFFFGRNKHKAAKKGVDNLVHLNSIVNVCDRIAKPVCGDFPQLFELMTLVTMHLIAQDNSDDSMRDETQEQKLWTHD